MKADVAEIGMGLLEHAAETAEFSASRGIVTELFPFIHAASRTMSSRAISRWLEEAHKMKLSAVTIAKALREPRKHWIAYAEELEPSVHILEDAHPNFSAADFLRDHNVFELMIGEPPAISDGNTDHIHYSLGEIDGAVQTLRDQWFSLHESSRNEMIYHILVDESEDKAAN